MAITVSMMVIAIFVAPHSVSAVSIHECRGNDGVVKFQDSPCLPGEASRKRNLPDDPVGASPATTTMQIKPDRAIEAEVGNAVSATVPSAQPSSTFLCQRQDGTRYVSASGVGNRYAVPLGALGYPPMTLGEAYGGPNGIGVSAPGLREIPVVPSRHGGSAGLYTWVEDPCTRVTGADLCAFYAAQLEDAQRRLRFAFSDTTEQVRTEIKDWQSRVASCRR